LLRCCLQQKNKLTLLKAVAFQRDSRQPVNRLLGEQVQAKNPAITVYSLMEILGQLSFNLSTERLSTWQSWLVDAYGLTIIWPVDPQDTTVSFSFRAEIFERPFERMLAHRTAIMDVLI
jgi:hypothetical protein